MESLTELLEPRVDPELSLKDKINLSLKKFQVQHTLIDAYLSINNSMVKLMTKAETALSEAQDRNQTPFIDSALEQLKSATTELNNAMKRVSDNVFF